MLLTLVKRLGRCQRRLCKCDFTAAQCFAKNRYDPKYKHYPQKNCSGGRKSRKIRKKAERRSRKKEEYASGDQEN